ncbi:MAG: chloride channel protein [Lentisphaeria bacterium]|nr:chloride channel protein [Lentisphaeria bacterium]
MIRQKIQHIFSSFTSMRTGSVVLRGALGEKNYILLLCCVVGVMSGLAAVLLRYFCELVHHTSTGMLPGGMWTTYLLPALPALGIFLCILFVRFWIRKPYEKSLAGVITSASNGTSEIPVEKTYSHIITSGISVGCGVSAGLEAPIALTGSAIGSNFAKLFHLGRESRTLLLACGGGAGISAVFNSPVAGALFACEILLPEFSIPALVPMLISSAIAAVVAELIYPSHTFMIQVTGWSMQNLPYYIMLGILAGVVSAFVIKTSCGIAKRFEPLKNVWVKGVIGALILYIIFLIFPMLRGEGYGFVNDLLNGNETRILTGSPAAFLFEYKWVFLALIGFLVLLKAAISPVGVESGGDGGIFAPSMFMGAFLGFFSARLIRMASLPGWEGISEKNFIAVGMGGVLAGVMHAPMTGIFLIAEITGGYKLFVPLMIVASLSCFICRKVSRYNVYKSMIAMRGGTPEQNKDVAAMEYLTVGELAEKNFTVVRQDDTLRSLLAAFMHSTRNIFPVVDTDNKLVGLVTLDNIRPFLLDDQLYDVALAYDIMSPTGPVLEYSDSLGDATKLFESCRLWNLPVVRNGMYYGFVSKSGVFDRYRDLLKNKPDLF